MKFKGNFIIKGVLKAKTGLHIGAQAAGIDIGRTDNPILKQVNENGEFVPYIPGSSLKGKIRSLLEEDASRGDPNFFNVEIQGKPGRHECKLDFLYNRIKREIEENRVEFNEEEKKISIDKGKVEITKEGITGRETDTYKKIEEVLGGYYPACDICTVFGRGAEHKGEEGPTRTIFRDAIIDENSVKGNDLVEIKWENTISRVTSEAMPRDMERAMRGAEFPFEVIYKIYDEDLNGGELKETYLFSWNNVPGNDSERLLRFLRDDLDIGWAENAEIHKSADGKIIRIFKDENSAEITIDEKKEKATLKISDDRTRDLKIKTEKDKLNICKETKIENFPENLRRRIKLIYNGFSLLDDDYLGGSGSRGYGKVEFKPFDIDLRKSDYYEGKSTNEKIIAKKSLREILKIL